MEPTVTKLHCVRLLMFLALRLLSFAEGQGFHCNVLEDKFNLIEEQSDSLGDKSNLITDEINLVEHEINRSENDTN